jgi:hypothetical protein
MTRFLVATMLGLALSPIVGCGARHPSAAEVLTLEVGPQTVACTGEAPQRCLRVRRTPDAPWTNFYGTIQGFTHEEGYLYRLEVDRQRVARPPADGSAYRYRLLRILSKTRAPGE